MDYCTIMHDAARIFNNRNPQYGDMRQSMERVANIVNLITGRTLTSYDVAMVLHAVKLSRIREDRGNPDHYVDGINYLAFAGELVETIPVNSETESAMDELEKNFANIAAKFCPETHDTTL